MKHFMLPRNAAAVLREADPATPSSSPNPSHSKSKMRRQKSSKENAPPPDPNSHSSPAAAVAAKMKSPLPPRPPSSNPLKRKLSIDALAENVAVGASDSGVKVVVRMRPLLKEEEESDVIVQKVSSDSLNINGQVFTFDSVADVDAKQQDIFQLVGAPLVENCLAGFNSSVFAYGQTGSGKTYTMWGPANALMDENVSSDQQGLTPRVFERLFARITEEQVKHADKQLKYQCRCSLLEIYNEQITDLLDPNQRNLQIREDVKSGVYVENLTEEYVCSMKDVTQLLIKGLSNRRTGATSINAESSRSHSVFTCVVESRCKSLSDGISSFKTSRINLVDLAGSERQKLTGAAGERLKEAGNINRSLSQLGNLINILSEVSTNNKARHIPYRDSKLTFLLQESLGGNAKLAMVCAISPAQRCKSETFSTLRFAQRAKAIKNKAVVNEVMQDDVNVLRQVIRQLKDELQRMKENGQKPADFIGGYSTGWNARRSLNLLKFSLNHPRTLSHVDEDGDEEMEIDEEAVERLCVQVGLQPETNECRSANQLDSILIKEQESEDTDVNMEDELTERSKNSEDSDTLAAANGIDISLGHMPVHATEDVNMEGALSKQAKNSDIITADSENSVAANATAISAGHLPIHGTEHGEKAIHQIVEKNDGDFSEQPSAEKLLTSPSIEHKREGSPDKDMLHELPSSALDPPSIESEHVPVAGIQSDGQDSGSCVSPSISVVASDVSPILKSPTPSVSPKLNQSRKSLKTSSMLTASQKDLKNDLSLGPVAMHESIANSPKCVSHTALSTHIRHSAASTKRLAASLQRGLEIIDGHRQSSALRMSRFRFSLKPTEPKTTLLIHKVNVGVQTFPQDDSITAEEAVAYRCSNCKKRKTEETEEDHDSLNMQLVPIDGTDSAEKSKKQVPKAVEKVLAGSIRREMALEEFCARQASEINQLSRLVQQYKHERECNGIIAQTREDKILRLESLMDGVLPSEEFMEEELISLRNEYNLLKDKYENHPELLRTKIELKRVQDELESYRNFHEFGEREVLLEEVQDLRNQLQDYIESSTTTSRRHNSVMQLAYSCEPKCTPPLSAIPETIGESLEEKLEQERIRWTEAESKWISLTEELRSELEASRLLAEKRKQELNTEKKCAEELKEAMQMAMEGHARMLEQYADLEERHILLLSRHRNIQQGIDDVKKAAARAGVRGAESKFINALAAEISALRVEREKERRQLRDENKGLQAQLKDTAEAVQAAGELLVRLKEAEEAVATVQKRAMDAEQEAVKAYKQIDKLKRKHEREISNLNELIAETRLPKEAIRPTCNDLDAPKYDTGECHDASDQQWREEFAPFYNGEDSDLSKLADREWFSGYDRCNI